MGKPKSLEEIKTELESWEFLQQLPKEILGFKLVLNKGLEGRVIFFASYVNEAMHCSLDLTYTGETFDYVPIKNIGLHSFRDERFFFRDREKFASNLLQPDLKGVTYLERLIRDVSRDEVMEWDYESKKLGFANWEYGKQLPKSLEGFELFIGPDNPVKYINGSRIFIDYTNFKTGNQLYIIYNTFRNEIFAEEKINFKPITTAKFTVPYENDFGERINERRKVIKDMDPEKLLTLLEKILDKQLAAELKILTTAKMQM